MVSAESITATENLIKELEKHRMISGELYFPKDLANGLIRTMNSLLLTIKEQDKLIDLLFKDMKQNQL